MLETSWTLTGVGITGPEQKAKTKSITVKALSASKLRSIKQEVSANNNIHGKAEKINVLLVQGNNGGESPPSNPERPCSQDSVDGHDVIMISPPSTKGRNNTDVGHVTKEEEITVYEEQQRTYPKELAVVLWDNVFQASPPAASNGGNTTAVQDSKPAAIRTPTLPDVYAPRPSLIRDSVMVTRTKEIDRYRVLYKIKYDNRKSKDSWLTMDGRLSIRTSKTGIPRIKQRWHEYVDRKNQLPGVYVKQRKTPKGQYFFWSGFACPLIWVIGSWYLEKTPNSADDMWRRRCSRASMIAGVAIVCGLVVFFVLHPSIFVPRMSFKPPIGTKVYGVE